MTTSYRKPVRCLAFPKLRRGAVEVVSPLEAAVPGAWLVIESVAEDLAIKRPLLATVDPLADKDAILATNSSSYPSSEMASAVNHPERLLNYHVVGEDRG